VREPIDPRATLFQPDAMAEAEIDGRPRSASGCDGGALPRPAARPLGPGDRIQRIRQRARHRSLGRRLLAIATGAAAVVAMRAIQPPGGYGPGTPVPVALRDLVPGELVTGTDVGYEARPAGLVPAEVAGDPVGRTVRSPVLAGEVLVEPRLGPGRGLGLDPGEVAVAVPRPLAVPPLAAGDLVQLVAVTAGGPTGASASLLDPLARVIDAGDESITLAVPAEAAPAVIEHQAAGTIEVVLTPWTG
jgi:hypothetical protein